MGRVGFQSQVMTVSLVKSTTGKPADFMDNLGLSVSAAMYFVKTSNNQVNS